MLLRCLPWLTAGLLACTFLPLLSDFPSTGDLIALALVPIIVGSALLMPWERLPTWAQAIPPLLPFAMVALVPPLTRASRRRTRRSSSCR